MDALEVFMKRRKVAVLLLVFFFFAFLSACTNPVNSVVGVTGVELSVQSFGMVVGETRTLMATVSPTNATDKEVTWTSADPSIAEVDESGTVRGISDGNTTITVTTDDGGFVAECGVLVGSLPVASVTLNETNIDLSLDQSYQLVATVLPAYATNKNVTWSSSNEAVVRIDVDQDGTIFAIAPGTAIVTVTTDDGGKTAQCNVKVSPTP